MHLARQRGLWGYIVYRVQRIQRPMTVASVDLFLFGLMSRNRKKRRLILRPRRSMVLLLHRRRSHLRGFQLRIPR